LAKDQDKKNGSGYECFHCGKHSVMWEADFDFADYGFETEGIVHVCRCTNCGAEIEYRIPITQEDIEEVQNGTSIQV